MVYEVCVLRGNDAGWEPGQHAPHGLGTEQSHRQGSQLVGELCHRQRQPYYPAFVYPNQSIVGLPGLNRGILVGAGAGNFAQDAVPPCRIWRVRGGR